MNVYIHLYMYYSHVVLPSTQYNHTMLTLSGGAAKTPPSSTDKDKAHPPDKRKLDRDLADNSKNIQEKEASLVSFTYSVTIIRIQYQLLFSIQELIQVALV